MTQRNALQIRKSAQQGVVGACSIRASFGELINFDAIHNQTGGRAFVKINLSGAQRDIITSS